MCVYMSEKQHICYLHIPWVHLCQVMVHDGCRHRLVGVNDAINDAEALAQLGAICGLMVGSSQSTRTDVLLVLRVNATLRNIM